MTCINFGLILKKQDGRHRGKIKKRLGVSRFLFFIFPLTLALISLLSSQLLGEINYYKGIILFYIDFSNFQDSFS